MSWREQLLDARFRGVPFFVRRHSMGLGRRVQLHEYPLRDKPYAEDLGRMTRTINVEAYVLGADYMQARNALIRAVEQPGPGQLVHPYLGEMQCTVLRCELGESTAEGGMAIFSLELVESGDANFPSASVNTGAAVATAADYGTQAVQANLERRLALARKPAFVAEGAKTVFTRALDDFNGALKRVRGAADQVAKLNKDVATAKTNATNLLLAPAEAGRALVGNLQQLVRSVASAPREALGLARLFYRFGDLLPAVGTSTASRRAQAINQAALLSLVRVAAVCEGALASTDIAFESYPDAVQVRDELVDAIELATLDGVDDDTYDALRALRAAVVRDVAARGANLARLVQWTPGATMPALVAAQRLYADGRRADELVLRNRVRHPLFVQGGQPLEVLSDAA